MVKSCLRKMILQLGLNISQPISFLFQVKKALAESEKKKEEVSEEFEKHKKNVVEAFQNATEIKMKESRKEIERLEVENKDLKKELEESKKLLDDAFKTASIERKKSEKSIRECSKVFEKKIAALERQNKSLEVEKVKSSETIAQLEDSIRTVETESAKKAEKKIDEFSKLKNAEVDELKKSLRGLKEKFEEEKQEMSDQLTEHEKRSQEKETEIKCEFRTQMTKLEKELESAKCELEEKEDSVKRAKEEMVALQTKSVQERIKMQKLHDEENTRRVQEKAKLEKKHFEELEKVQFEEQERAKKEKLHSEELTFKVEELEAKLELALEEKEKSESAFNGEKQRLQKEYDEKSREVFKKLEVAKEERSKEKAGWEDSWNTREVAFTKLKIELKDKEIEVAKTKEEFKKNKDALIKDIGIKDAEVSKLKSEKEEVFKKLDETSVRLDEMKEQVRGSERIATSLKDGNKNLMEQKLSTERELSKIKDKLFKSEANHENAMKEKESQTKALATKIAELKSQEQKSRENVSKVLNERLRKLETNLKTKTVELEKAKRQATSFKETGEKQQKLADMYAIEKETLLDDLDKLRQEDNNKKETIALLNQSIEKERAENEKKNSQRNHRADLLQKLIAQTKAENATLKSELQTESTQTATLKNELENLRNENQNLKESALKAKAETDKEEKDKVLADMKRKRHKMEEQIEEMKEKRRCVEEDDLFDNGALSVQNLSEQLKARNEQLQAKCAEFEEYKENSITAARAIIATKKKEFDSKREDLELQVRSALKEKDFYKEGMFKADVEALEGKIKERKEVLEALEAMPVKYRRKMLKKLHRRKEGEYLEEMMKEEIKKDKEMAENDDNFNTEEIVISPPIIDYFGPSNPPFKTPSLPMGIVNQKSQSLIISRLARKCEEKKTERPSSCPDTPRPPKLSFVAPRPAQHIHSPSPANVFSKTQEIKKPTMRRESMSSGMKPGNEVQIVHQVGTETRQQKKVSKDFFVF